MTHLFVTHNSALTWTKFSHPEYGGIMLLQNVNRKKH